MRILHFSDIHLGLGLRRVPLRDWAGKRLAGGLNLLRGRQRRFAGARRKLAALARLASTEGVDMVVFTGDFTALGTERELQAARELLAPFVRAPLGMVCVPGNHDLYARDVLRERRFERHFGDLLETDLPELRTDGVWPLVRLSGKDVAVVAVNSARPNPLPWKSSGRVPEPQVAGLSAALRHPRVADRFALIVTHYAPCLPDGRPDHRNHRLVNAADFLAACAPVERGAILCGHVHRTYRARVAGVKPEVLCAGSATLHGHEGFWMIDVENGGTTALRGWWTIDGFELDVERLPLAGEIEAP